MAEAPRLSSNVTSTPEPPQLTPPCSRHQAEFLLGKRFYSKDSFQQAAEHFEVAVREFFTSNQECRVLCEGAYNYDGYNYMEYSADLFQTISGKSLGCVCADGTRLNLLATISWDPLCVSDHYMQVLSCKQRCALELATNTDQPFQDFLPSHFNYLQFSYYNSETDATAIFGPPAGESLTSSVFG